MELAVGECKPSGQPHRERLSWGSVALMSVAGLYLLLVIGPLLALLLLAPGQSFTSASLWSVFRSTMWLTAWTSLAATALAFVLGLPTALCLARVDFPGKKFVNALVELPVALPPLVLGVALLVVWGRKGVVGQYLAEAGSPLSFTSAAVVIAQFVVASPFFVRIARVAIERVPRTVEEASLTLGVGKLETYLRVTLPMARNGILNAAVTCCARAMGEFGATFFFAGNFPGRTQTIPLAIFTTMQCDVSASIGLAVIMAVFSLVAFVLAWHWLGRNEG